MVLHYTGESFVDIFCTSVLAQLLGGGWPVDPRCLCIVTAYHPATDVALEGVVLFTIPLIVNDVCQPILRLRI